VGYGRNQEESVLEIKPDSYLNQAEIVLKNKQSFVSTKYIFYYYQERFTLGSESAYA